MKTQDAETDGSTMGESAKHYDLFAFPEKRARNVMSIFPSSSGERVLDVGCGTGTLALLLKDAVGEAGYVVAVDAAAGMIDVAKDKVAKFSADIDCKVAAIENMPFEDAEFDRVYSTLMTHHLPTHVKQAGFKEVLRVLKPGGEYCIVDIGEANTLIRKIVFFIPGITHGGGTLKPHLRGELPQFLKDAGFAEVEVVHRSFGMDFMAAKKAG